jgi:hypothetical protein
LAELDAELPAKLIKTTIENWDLHAQGRSLLSDILCAASDTLDALELFSQLLQEKYALAYSVGYMEFDA